MQLEQELARHGAGEPVPPPLAEALLAAADTAWQDHVPAPEERAEWWRFLDLTSRPRFLTALGDDGTRGHWAELCFAVTEATRFTLGALFDQRVAEAPGRPLFRHA